ncbi:uncharacterized protein LAESUDRAFT_724683 [Laetiporus sulphureus 93-53]|uniref:Histone acetyltransferase n=1 Tax=Laetiporus sulphureus 93-53 TaxID=1314785 RepID=A0A165ESZ2_9APHY|nr:uncharacterized protein LAESUDRAFT_724683 [Laetiporus sulphureus 93-53]KZT07692.1 hypothetical protein LAESUDRAFT_724683 [Laetiporus sulphureus 93-53]
MSAFGLPEGAVFHQPETQDLTCSPGSGMDIPIDPALSEPQLDPALLMQSAGATNLEAICPPMSMHQNLVSQQRQYSQGPQGDPFAPQPPAFITIEGPRPLPPKPAKKKRTPRREEECGFCQGNDSKNKKTGQPELMVSCSECGRSAHPGCLGLSNIGDHMRSYAWTCPNCKKCEVCHAEEGDFRMIICDFCDRGWHMDCLQPPLAKAPPGTWHCPLCPQLMVPEQIYPMKRQQEFQLPGPEPISQHPHYLTKILPEPGATFHESSVASSSRMVNGTAPDTVGTTDSADVDIDCEVPYKAANQKGKKRNRSKGRTLSQDANELEDPDETSAAALPHKRMRLRLSSPVATPSSPPPPKTVIRLRLPARDKGKAREEDPPDEAVGMFDEILSEKDRSVKETSIVAQDKQRFERSLIAAEEKLHPPPPPPEVSDTGEAGPSTRPLRSSTHRPPPSSAVSGPARSESPPRSTPAPLMQKLPDGPRIRRIRFGDYDIETWYDAPFPEEYANIPEGRLWYCEFCLKYMRSKFMAGRHQLKCKMRHPPGDEIYRDGAISIFEVDGRRNKIYCQNLCLLSKMFLDHKSLFYDVEPFLFYVVTEFDDVGSRFIGYFSKEKRSPKDYNVSCIMTLPVRQRQGWGQLLIDFSYLLSKKEQRAGSPEKPLSPLGALGYRSYWTFALMRYFRTAPPNPRIEDISAATSMTTEDIYNTLMQLKLIRVDDNALRPKPLPGQAIKFPKGRKNGVARKHLQRNQTQDDEKVKGPFVAPIKYEIRWDPIQVEEYMAKWEAKNYITLKPEKLKWSPFIVARTGKTDQLPSDDMANGRAASTQSHDLTNVEPEGTPARTAPVTPRSGAPIDTRETSVMATKSPAFSLFDDDNVITISSSRNSSTRDQPEAETAHSPGRSAASISVPNPASELAPESVQEPAPVKSPEDEQVERDRALAEELARTLFSPSRRLRSSAATDVRSPVERRRTLRDEVSTRKSKPAAGRRTPGHGATGKQARGNVGDSAGMVGEDEDAALAARLAREEEQRLRQLRSRPATDRREAKRSRPSSRSASPRKRRRIDSSPEVEHRPTPPPPPTRRNFRRTLNDAALLAESRDLGELTRVVNGDGVPLHASPSPISSSDTNVTDNHPAYQGFGRALTSPNIETSAPANASNNGQSCSSTTQAQEPEVIEDLKYEDAGTPLTINTSRHSVPSDDTVCVTEDHARDFSKASPGGPAIEIHPLQPLKPEVTGAVPIEVNREVEEDAEGEEDADAEGELDMDG